MNTNKLKQNIPTKLSGIDWIGDILNDWISRRGKFVFRSGKKINKGMKCENILSLTMRGVISRSELGEGGLLPGDYSTFQIFEKDDLVFKLIDLENYKTSRVGMVHEQGIMSSAYIRIFPKLGQDISVKYFYYYYYNLYLEGIYNFLGMGVRSTMNDADLLEMGIVIPPKETQEKIVVFLDEKTAVVDAVIARKKRLIGLLKEKRSSIITHAVTKGLDPNAPTKPSGIDWIGDIPSNWELEKIKKYIQTRSSGLWGNDEKEDKNDITCVRVADFDYENLRVDLKNKTKRNISDNVSMKILRGGDLLLEKSGGGEKTPVGRVVLFDLDEIAICSNFVERISFRKEVDSKFFSYVFFVLHLVRINTKYIKQTTGIQNLSLGEYFLEYIPIPSFEEQVAISDYIENVIFETNSTIAKVERQIILLKEYRASLIYHCVTGKISV